MQDSRITSDYACDGGWYHRSYLEHFGTVLMTSDQVFSVAVTVVLASAGWWIGYVTTLRRDRLTKQRDLRTQYLIEAYRRLESAFDRTDAEARIAIESAIADIQLLGSPEQVQLARNFGIELQETHSADLNVLLESLRKELRLELGLPLARNKVFVMRSERERPSGKENESSPR